MDKQPISTVNLQRYELFISALGVSVWEYHIDRDEMNCSERWYDIVGAEYGTIKCLDDFKTIIHSDDVASATEVDEGHIAELFVTGDPYRAAFRVLHGNGSIVHVKSVASLIRNPDDGGRLAIGWIAPAVIATDACTFYEGERPIARKKEDLFGLTRRERQCLHWVSQGKTAWETATIIGVSSRTVEYHLANATRKLSAANKIHAAFLAVGLDLLY